MTLPHLCTRAFAAGACAATLLLTGCGASAVTVTPSAGASAAASPTAEPQSYAGTGFRTNIPAGWASQATNQSSIAPVDGTGTVLMVLVSLDHGMIVASITPQPVGDDQLAQYLTSITPAGASDVSQAEPVDIDGVSGVVTTFVGGSAGVAASESEVMVVNQAGDTYEMVLSTAQANFAKDEAGLQEVLDSWSWA